MNIPEIFTITALSTSLTVGASRFLPPFQATFITVGTEPTGETLVEPIYTPQLALQAENMVARRIGKGEALRCTTSVRVKDAWVDQMLSKINTIMLDCDGAKFSVVGLRFEKETP